MHDVLRALSLQIIWQTNYSAENLSVSYYINRVA
jgi:hypothetical protein